MRAMKPAKKKGHYNVLAVYSLRNCADREHFSGVLDEMANTSNWHLSTIPPEHFTKRSDLVNEHGEQYDGAILSLPGSDEVIARIARSRLPTVLVNITDSRLSARCDAVANVWTDNASIGESAARHLLERGEYSCAGYVHEFGRPFWSRERLYSFRQTMKSGGCATFVFPETGDQPHTPDSQAFVDGLRRWLRALPKPAAVMAASDMRAADVIIACRLEGIPVPSQAAVVGVDHDASQHMRCGMKISSVELNSRMMGRQAVRELDYLLKHPKWKGRPHEVLIPAKGVFANESTSRSVSATRLVNIALDFIAANSMLALTPNDVVVHLGCSRRLAEIRFSQVAGTTIHKAINEARLNEVQRRIKSGDSVAKVVKAMQFKSANQLYRLYKRHFGKTIRAKPSVY